MTAAQAALEKQGEAVLVLDVRAVSTVTDFFVICTAGSSRQVEALKDHVETTLLQRGCPVGHIEGAIAPRQRSRPFTPPFRAGFPEEPLWALMDYGDLVVHLFDQRARAFYRLEDLWADAPRIPIESASRHPA